MIPKFCKVCLARLEKSGEICDKASCIAQVRAEVTGARHLENSQGPLKWDHERNGTFYGILNLQGLSALEKLQTNSKYGKRAEKYRFTDAAIPVGRGAGSTAMAIFKAAHCNCGVVAYPEVGIVVHSPNCASHKAELTPPPSKFETIYRGIIELHGHPHDQGDGQYGKQKCHPLCVEHKWRAGMRNGVPTVIMDKPVDERNAGPCFGGGFDPAKLYGFGNSIYGIATHELVTLARQANRPLVIDELVERYRAKHEYDTRTPIDPTTGIPKALLHRS